MSTFASARPWSEMSASRNCQGPTEQCLAEADDPGEAVVLYGAHPPLRDSVETWRMNGELDGLHARSLQRRGEFGRVLGVAIVDRAPARGEESTMPRFAGTIKDITTAVERMKWVLDPTSPNEIYIGDRKCVRDWM